MASEHGELVELVLAADAPGFAAKLDQHIEGVRSR
jgi:DNA-binding GntR family transcriptional regulator